MAEGHGAAVHVELRVGYVQLAANAFDAAERLVHLEEIDVGDSPPGLLEAALDRAFRGREESLGLVGELTRRDDARDGLRAQLARPCRRRDDHRAAAVLEL